METSFSDTIEAVRKEMAGEPAEVQIGYRIDCIVRELDELCALTANAETVDLIESNKVGVGQLFVRCKTLALLLMAQRPAQYGRAA